MSIRIETFSRKRFGRRRQYHARIVHENGNQLWRTSEGYSNRGERDAAIAVLAQAGLDVMVVALP